jgi:hypothetical protein
LLPTATSATATTATNFDSNATNCSNAESLSTIPTIGVSVNGLNIVSPSADFNFLHAHERYTNAMHAANRHGAECGSVFVDASCDRKSWNVKDTFKCSCGYELVSNSRHFVRSNVVSPGTKFSRTQCDLSLTAPAAAKNNGFNDTNLIEFMSELGCQAPSQCAYRKQVKKIRQAIIEECDDQLRKSRIKHNKAAREHPDYNREEDEIWIKDPDTGDKIYITATTAGIDGYGFTRAYAHNYNGTQSAIDIVSLHTGDVLYIKVDRTACMKCTKAMHEAIRAGKDFRNYLGQHEGECNRNSKYGPAVAEEFALEKAGYDLLFDKDGNLLPYDERVFLTHVCGDGDSKGAKKLIQKQVDALIDAGYVEGSFRGKALKFNDGGHVRKNVSNGFYDLRKRDGSFRGKAGLSNGRISALVSDLRGNVKALGEKLQSKDLSDAEKDSSIQECHECNLAVIPHHCGDHSKCLCVDRCSYLRLKKENPEWDKAVLSEKENEELEMAYSNSSRFPNPMMLDKEGRLQSSRCGLIQSLCPIWRNCTLLMGMRICGAFLPNQLKERE